MSKRPVSQGEWDQRQSVRNGPYCPLISGAQQEEVQAEGVEGWHRGRSHYCLDCGLCDTDILFMEASECSSQDISNFVPLQQSDTTYDLPRGTKGLKGIQLWKGERRSFSKEILDFVHGGQLEPVWAMTFNPHTPVPLSYITYVGQHSFPPIKCLSTNFAWQTPIPPLKLSSQISTLLKACPYYSSTDNWSLPPWCPA